MASPTQITVSQLAKLIGTPDCPVLVDICIDEDFAEDPCLIPGAFRHSHKDVDALCEKLNGRKVIIVCQKGLKLSQGLAAVLRCHGINAESLEGGVYGWREANLPMIPAAVIPSGFGSGKSRWVTRARPKIDRVACPWLIRRFVDPSAEFLFVAPSQVDLVAEKFGATAFDMEGGDWSHEGDECTFDTMLNRFELEVPALRHMARIIRGADTGDLKLEPEAVGLTALSLGLSRMFKNDLEQLENGMLIYDALYRWARDATKETHGWPS